MNTAKYILIFIVLKLIVINNNISGQEPGTRQWTYVCGSYCSAIAVDTNGTIYAGVRDGLLALNKDSTFKWKAHIQIGPVYSPTVGKDGTIYCANSIDSVYAINPDGSFKWRIKTNRSPYSITIGPEETLYFVGIQSDTLNAYDHDGNKKWTCHIHSNMINSPIIAMDGSIYFVNGYGNFIILDKNGTEIWHLDSLFYGSTPALGSDGTVYIHARQALYAIDPMDSIKWVLRIDEPVANFFSYATPVVSSDQNIYLTTEDGFLYSISPQGYLNWKIYIGSIEYSKIPLVGRDGIIYVANDEANLYAVNPDSTINWIYTGNSGEVSDINISTDGTIYLKQGSEIQAISSSSKGLAQNAWPKFKGNAMNTGNGINNNYPVIVIDTSYIAIIPDDTLVLDASRSFDPNGSSLTFKWSVLEKPLKNTFDISGTNSSVLKIPLKEEDIGQYKFLITIYNESDLAASMGIDVTCGLYWTKKIEDFPYIFNGAPALSKNDILYCFAYPESLYAINPNGDIVWSVNNSSQGNVSVGPDGEVYLGSDSKKFAKYSSKGKLIKDYWLKTSIFAIDNSGDIILSRYNYGQLYNIDNNTFEMNWKTWPGGTDIVIDKNHNIYTISNNRLYSINQYGYVNWEVETGPSQGISVPKIAVGPDGTIYQSAYDHKLYAVNPEGKIKWTYTAGGILFCSPSIGEDSTIYQGCDDGKLYALNPDGKLKWTFETGESIRCVPAIGSKGIIYFTSNDGNIYAVNPDSTQLWSLPINCYDSYGGNSPSIASDGTIYIKAGMDLYALFSSNRGLASSSWPKYRQNIFNTSSVIFDSKSQEGLNDIDFENSLFSIHPNPVNEKAYIDFYLSQKALVSIQIFNQTGQLVEIIENKYYNPGFHEINYKPESLYPGIYFCVFIKNDTRQTCKLIVE